MPIRKCERPSLAATFAARPEPNGWGLMLQALICGAHATQGGTWETTLCVPGNTNIGCWTVLAEIISVPREVRQVSPNEAYLDVAETGPGLTIRRRRPGDRLRPLGLSGEKKLQDILVDSKLPARDRDGIPIVCAGDQIAWVVGHCIDERFALTHRKALVELADQRGIVLARHDYATENHDAKADGNKVTIAEFPTTMEAAQG